MRTFGCALCTCHRPHNHKVGALYVILGRLWLTPASGERVGVDGEAAMVTPEEERFGVEAFRKGACLIVAKKFCRAMVLNIHRCRHG